MFVPRAGPGERAGGVETEAQRQEREGYLAQVLEIIEEKKFLSPLAVVQLLGSPLAGNVRFVLQKERKKNANLRNRNLFTGGVFGRSVGVIRPFLVRTFTALAEEKADAVRTPPLSQLARLKS